jgi:hypothetical protein
VLARDRLLGAYEVKPALGRLKGVLLGAGVSLAAASAALSVLIGAPCGRGNAAGCAGMRR